jgi:hypothetical protein
MKKILLIVICILFSNSVISQNTIEIEFTKDKEVLLNKTKLSNSMTIEDIKELLGEEPIIYKEYLTGKINYHYKEFGISIHTSNGKFAFIGLNFNWDGDKTFPKNSYTGIFKIGDLTIDIKTDLSIIEKIKFVELLPIMPNKFFMSNPKKEKTPIIIGFKDKLITQVGFEFH